MNDSNLRSICQTTGAHPHKKVRTAQVNCNELKTLLGRQAVHFYMLNQLQKAVNGKHAGMLTHKVMETKTTVERVSSSLSYRHQIVPIETNGDFVSTAHQIDSTNDKVQIKDAEVSLDFKQDSEGRRQRM